MQVHTGYPLATFVDTGCHSNCLVQFNWSLLRIKVKELKGISGVIALSWLTIMITPGIYKRYGTSNTRTQLASGLLIRSQANNGQPGVDTPAGTSTHKAALLSVPTWPNHASVDTLSS